MAQSWPAYLQDYLNEESFNYAPGETAVKSENDIGPAKRRQRFTKPVKQLSATITVKRDLVDDFESFFYDTLAGGVLAFEFTHPITGILKEFKMDAPAISPKGGEYFTIQMNWEEQL